MRRVRVAFIPAALRPGGAERQMLALAERLPRDRFEVDFLVLSGPGEYDQRAASVGARVRHVGAAPTPGTGVATRMLRRATKTTDFVRIARAGRYDILDAWLYPSDVLAALTRGLTKVPVVISGRRNLDPHEQFGPVGRLVDAAAMRLTDAVVANSAAAARYAIEHEGVDPASVRVIRNGVEPIAPLEPAELATRRIDLGAREGELVIGCVANYLPVKRHDRLIHAFAAVARAVPAARLVLVGEGPLRPQMAGLIQSLGIDERVRLYGSVADATRLLGGFDVMVQASRSEGSPNALLEAAAAGKAIVATAAGGSDEIVVDGVTGLLVPVDDVDAMRDALLRVLSDAALRDRLGVAARERTLSVFGMDRFVAEFSSLYLELIEARGRLG